MRGRGLAAATTAVLGAGLLFAPGASAAFTPCKKGSKLQCDTVRVPLDRSGAVKGTVALEAIKQPARRGPAAGTLMVLAGGPGQSAAAAVDPLLVRALPNYDIVVFDQRGTGSSALKCKALRQASNVKAFARCGRELGAKRGFYRSYDSAEDIEAVRLALGGPKLTLVATSYGARVAGEYIRRHPGTVVRQVLDSPSPITGTDPFSRQVIASQPRVFDTLAGGTERRLARLTARLRTRALWGTVISGRGRAVRGKISESLLYDTLTALDLDPYLRGEVPGAVRAAVAGDSAPLARIVVGSSSSSDTSDAGVSVPTFLATSCSEAPVPWDPAVAPTRTRLRQAQGAVRALGGGAFRPFSAATVVGSASSLITQCAGWPAVPKAPALPDAAGAAAPVPTLVLEGREDTRTPLEQGRQIAATYAPSSVLTIPYTGHSTLGADLSSCANRAAAQFVRSGTAPAACPPRPRPYATPVVRQFPRSIRSLRGSAKARSTRAGLLAVEDAVLHVGATLRFGGLRGGTARISKGALLLSNYEYLKDVRVTGRIRLKRGIPVGVVHVRGPGVLPVRVTFSLPKSSQGASVSAFRPRRPLGIAP